MYPRTLLIFRDFDQLINLGTDTIRNFLAQCSNVTVFVPLKTALQRLKNVPGIDFNSNPALVDRVIIIKIHILTFIIIQATVNNKHTLH